MSATSLDEQRFLTHLRKALQHRQDLKQIEDSELLASRVADLELDSLEQLDVLAAVEDLFGVILEGRELQSVDTLSDLLATSKLAAIQKGRGR